MDVQELQSRIDQISWYHEFDFPGGLVARPRTPDLADHRRIWRFIQQELDQIDFTGKSVLDLGCWDGYWSFYAERRGARRVLATDDRTQNWAGNQGLLLAKKLLNSSVDSRLDVSVYDLAKLQEQFDVILCMGIYYHLVDPFYAFSQIRHLCHDETVVVFEGDGTASLDPPSIYYDPSEPSHAVFMPTERTLRHMLEANYFRIVSLRSLQSTRPRLRRIVSLGMRALRRLQLSKPVAFRYVTRFFVVCRAAELANPLHAYRPPFGLHRYDVRFRD